MVVVVIVVVVEVAPPTTNNTNNKNKKMQAWVCMCVQAYTQVHAVYMSVCTVRICVWRYMRTMWIQLRYRKKCTCKWAHMPMRKLNAYHPAALGRWWGFFWWGRGCVTGPSGACRTRSRGNRWGHISVVLFLGLLLGWVEVQDLVADICKTHQSQPFHTILFYSTISRLCPSTTGSNPLP